MTALCEFEAKLAGSWPPRDWQDVTVVLAVSGGPDSTAMLRAMTALPRTGAGRLVVAHFNHRLRGREADADERFVVDLAADLGVSCEVGRSEPGEMDQTGGEGLEAVARRARYAFLQRTAHRVGARFVATAHTADDQVETILHRIVRGTGISGLSGMRRARPLGPDVTLLRPMLQFCRSEVVDYLDELGQPSRRDPSNDDPQFTRSRIRRDLVPRLAAEYNANVREAILRLGALAGEAQAAIDRRVDGLIERAVAAQPDEIVEIACAELAGTEPYIVRELLIAVWRRQGWPEQAMGYAQWDELARLAREDPQTDSRKKMFPGRIVARRRAGKLLLVHSVSHFDP